MKVGFGYQVGEEDVQVRSSERSRTVATSSSDEACEELPTKLRKIKQEK